MFLNIFSLKPQQMFLTYSNIPMHSHSIEHLKNEKDQNQKKKKMSLNILYFYVLTWFVSYIKKKNI